MGSYSRKPFSVPKITPEKKRREKQPSTPPKTAPEWIPLEDLVFPKKPKL